MRRALVLALLVALPLARADDKKKDGPFRWDPRQRPRVVPGTRTFYDYELTGSFHTAFGKKDSFADVSSLSETRSSYRWVRRVIGVESGAVSDAEVAFERWRQGDDATLESKSATLARKGGKLVAKLDDPEGVSIEAQKWLEGEVFKGSGRTARTEYVEDLLLPREPAEVTTGCTWTRDPKAVALGLLQSTDLDPQRSSVAGTLEEVHVNRGVHYGKAAVKAVLQMRKLDQSEYRYTDGALVTITWTYEGSLEPSRREDSARELVECYEGKVKLGSTLEALTRSERTETLKCGPARK
jgi:hypothetical protein